MKGKTLRWREIIMKDVMWLEEYLGGEEIIQSMTQAKRYNLTKKNPSYVTIILTDLAFYVLERKGTRVLVERYSHKNTNLLMVNVNGPGELRGMPHFTIYQNKRFICLFEAVEIVNFSTFVERLSNHIVSRQGKRELVIGITVEEWLAKERKLKHFLTFNND